MALELHLKIYNFPKRISPSLGLITLRVNALGFPTRFGVGLENRDDVSNRTVPLSIGVLNKLVHKSEFLIAWANMYVENIRQARIFCHKGREFMQRFFKRTSTF